MSGVFAKLLEDGQAGRVTGAIEELIAKSFASHPMRHATRAEIKRRFDLCAGIVQKLRGELRWGVERILDRLPEYFIAELNGLPWTPDERTCWMPEDGR